MQATAAIRLFANEGKEKEMNGIDLSVRGAVRRIQHLITTDYLPPGLIRDIEIVIEAAVGRRDDNGQDIGSNGMVIDVDFGAMVKTARKAKGYSQPKLAMLVGTSQQTVDKIESGKVERSSFLPAIFHELGLPLERLVMARSRQLRQLTDLQISTCR